MILDIDINRKSIFSYELVSPNPSQKKVNQNLNHETKRLKLRNLKQTKELLILLFSEREHFVTKLFIIIIIIIIICYGQKLCSCSQCHNFFFSKKRNSSNQNSKTFKERIKFEK